MVAEPLRFGVIGGGMTGLATAWHLAGAGARVTVIEREAELGGLVRSAALLPGLVRERYYHAILTTDADLIGLLDELGLKEQLEFRETRTGFFTDGRLHSMSSTLEFLRFPALSLIDKARLGLGILYATRVNDRAALERANAATWLTGVFGRRIYRKIWEPLLRSKFGSAKEQASAALIWAIIRRYYGTRSSGQMKERMGHVRGGYQAIVDRLRDRLEQRGVRIVTGCPVEALGATPGNGVAVRAGGEHLAFDRVVVTVANPALVRLWPEMPPAYRERLGAVRYLDLICVTLVLRRQLSPFYVTNLTDEGLPFTGLIEGTHLLPDPAGRAVVYLPRYMPAGDPWWGKTDQEVMAGFLAGLRRIFPELRDEEVLAAHLWRDRHVQPIQEVGYSDKIVPLETPLPNLFLLNTTRIADSTLNNNEVVRIVREALPRLTAAPGPLPSGGAGN